MERISEIIIASQNQGKVLELTETLKQHIPTQSFSVYSLDQARQKSNNDKVLPDVVEDGKTFFDNALIKAQSYFHYFQRPVLADDSGLILQQFPDILGVQSARFAPELNYSQKCERIWSMYSDQKVQSHSASFQCVLCLYLSDKSHFFFSGTLEGRIGAPQGDKGFGYDPIFYPLLWNADHRDSSYSSQSLAQNPDWKRDHSHRTKAMTKLCRFLRGS